jgi:hypothetical protein
MKVIVAQALNSDDFATVNFCRQGGAGAYGSPVQENRACTANLHVASPLGTGQSKLLP